MTRQLKKEDLNNLIEKYGARVTDQFDEPRSSDVPDVRSKEYMDFKEEMMPRRYSYYEKACNMAEGILKIGISPKRFKELSEYIRISHLQITPYGVEALGILAPMAFGLIGAILSIIFKQFFFCSFFSICSNWFNVSITVSSKNHFKYLEN